MHHVGLSGYPLEPEYILYFIDYKCLAIVSNNYIINIEECSAKRGGLHLTEF